MICRPTFGRRQRTRFSKLGNFLHIQIHGALVSHTLAGQGVRPLSNDGREAS